MLSHRRQQIYFTWLVIATAMTSCTDAKTRPVDMLAAQKDASEQSDLGRDSEREAVPDTDTAADTGSDSTTNEDRYYWQVLTTKSPWIMNVTSS